MTTMLAEQTAAAERPVDPETLKHVRASVKEILTNNPRYMAMPAEVKRDSAHDMVRATTNTAGYSPARMDPDPVRGAVWASRPKPRRRDGGRPQRLPDSVKTRGLPRPPDSSDDQTVEERLVPAARQRMALDRQHLLATM